MIARYTLQNGITVLLDTVQHTRTVSIGFWFLHGSRDERADEYGMSHFLEHMLFKGTKNFSSLEIVKSIDRVGGVLNAFTEKEQTCFYCIIAYRHIELAVKLLSEITFHSILPENEIEREKKVIQNEIAEVEDVPEEKAYEIFLQKIWGNHPLANRITGEYGTIQSITREKCMQFYEEWYIPANLVVSVAGNVDADEIITLLEKNIAGSGKNRPIRKRKHPKQYVTQDYIPSHFQQVQVITGTSFPVPDTINQFYHFLVFSTIFGESMSSRLFQGIRENLGLCYSIQAMRTFFSSTALWNVYVNTSPALLNKLIEGLNEEFTKLVNDSIDEEELKDAVTHLSGGLILSLEDMEVRMKRMVRHYILGGDIHEADESIRILESINIDDVRRVVQKYIKCEHFSLLVYGTRNLNRRKKKVISF